MYASKTFIALAAFSGAALSQELDDATCSKLIADLVAMAPAIPSSFIPFFQEMNDEMSGGPDGLLTHPGNYVDGLCSLAASLPADDLAEFAAYGSDLLHFASVEISSYDQIVTGCVSTGAAGASITSYIHSIASNPANLCQAASTTADSVTATITPAPYPTGAGGNSTVTTGLPVPSSSIPTAAAARPTNILAGAAAMGGLLGVVALL